MSLRSITQQFGYLGAPLVNDRWSWGSSVESAVVLRVWQDRRVKIDDKWYVRITHNDKYMNYDKQGWKERLSHVDEVKAGKPCYLIFCLVKDPESSTREIKSFDQRRVWLGGEVIEVGGEDCIELVEPLSVEEGRKRIQTKGS